MTDSAPDSRPMTPRDQQDLMANARYTKRTATRGDFARALLSKSFDRLDIRARIFTRAKSLLDARLGGFSETVHSLDDQSTNDIYERVLQANDLMPANFLSDGMSRLSTICRIRLNTQQGVAFGTGFLVAPGIVLTNNHVISSESDAHLSTAEFGAYRKCEHWSNHSFDPGSLFITSSRLDYTFVALSEPHNDNLGFNKLDPRSGKALIGERLNILQHPSGRDMELSIRNNKVVDVFDEFIHYETDTEPGSSGSPVYNDQWQVVALHHAGVPGPSGNRVTWVANEGVRISAIMEHMASRRLHSRHSDLLRGYVT